MCNVGSIYVVAGVVYYTTSPRIRNLALRHLLQLMLRYVSSQACPPSVLDSGWLFKSTALKQMFLFLLLHK